MGVHNLSNKADFTSAQSETGLFVVDFFATWCGPCKAIAPKVVTMADDFPSVRFYKIDIDEVPDVSHEYGVRAMPTFMIFKGEEKVAEVVGANPQALRAAIEKEVSAAEA
ncbi:MAG: hypothetical protein HETSPECPRED_003139 [Heterodermia speciosa]|uniref:Thioredoxin n=1 Tax=Heterodermia speciosa TaxID=116794 RepID=A0A8H3IIS3_9LECA|nr:MAG: hypothetical protein HETSPECPRED_003139 [Heterodermia speciosa]